MKVKEIIQRVQSLYSKGVQSDDTRLSDRHIYNKLLTTRSLLLSQKSNKKQNLSDWNFQTIPYVELDKKMPYDIPELPNVGCEVLRSKVPIPNIVSNLNGLIIRSVTSLEGSINYSETNWVKVKYQKGNRYMVSKPNYYFRGNYLYSTYISGSKILSLTAIFENPLDVYNYNSKYNKIKGVNPLDIDFHIENTLIDILVDLTTKELVQLFSANMEDISNDSKDSLNEKSK